jgi:hypothetical protein
MTDLHTALREAVADAPFDQSDMQAVLAAGSRRVRRRVALTVGSSALVAAAVVITSLVVAADRSGQDPGPADVVHLDLSQAERVHPDVLASVRTTYREPIDDFSGESFEGVTTDGRVLLSRSERDGDSRLGLLSPTTGTTEWLPPEVAGAPVELTADRLVLFAQVRPNTARLGVFDRQSQTWETSELRLPARLEAHVPPRLTLGPDGRLYLGSNLEGESVPVRWWSYELPQGGKARPEPALAGAGMAWRDGVQVRADSDGTVTVSDSGADRVVAEERPDGCTLPNDPVLAGAPALVGLAGDRPVVTYFCGDEAQAVTLVYDLAGSDAVRIDGASLLTADNGYVLLGGGGTYLLDLHELALAQIGPGLHENQVGLGRGVVLWNNPGPVDDKDAYDVVWKVARLPLDD